MPFKRGDFILLDYVAKVVETGEVFDTTMEDIAKKEGIYREGALYEPMLVVVGEGWVLKALDEALEGLELNKKSIIEIPPEKAFGPRDPEKVKLYPLRRLRARGIRPQVGMRVEIDGRLATIRTIGSGRVQLDFNLPLAGKTIVYEVTVRRLLETEDEKMKALVHRRIPSIEIKKFRIEINSSEVTIYVPEEAFYVEGLQVSKRGIWLDIQKFFPEKKVVRFIEEFRKESSEDESSLKETSEGTEGSQKP